MTRRPPEPAPQRPPERLPEPAPEPVQALLHVGAPKCGSSALQRALSLQPELTDAAGRRHVYLAAWGGGTVSGRRLSAMARRAVHGYMAWPNLTPGKDDAARYWSGLAQALSGARRRGAVPVLSCEGWIAHAAAAPGLIRAAGLDRLDVAAYLRPPLDWLNAAFWQWGIWDIGPYTPANTGAWLTRAGFDPGPQLAAWAAVPGVRLQVESARGDVVADFAARHGLPLDAGGKVNAAPPPALTGFMLRNRRFRPTPHDSAVDFVVQRWCRFAPAARPWAFLPEQVAAVWPRLQQDVARLMEALPGPVAGRLLADPAWTSTAPYAARMEAGPTELCYPQVLSELFDGLAEGLRRAGATGPGGTKPRVGAPVTDWDAAIAALLDALIAADRRWRRAASLRRLLGA